MAFDIQLRTPEGVRRVSQLQAIRLINKLVYTPTFNSASGSVNTFVRNHTQSLRDYTDFNGKDFTIFAIGGCSNVNGGLLGVEVTWNGGRVINANSTFSVRFTAGLMLAGTYRYIVDLYIMENGG